MSYDDKIELSESYQTGFLIKPVEGVSKRPQCKERRERQKNPHKQSDEMVLSQEALDAMDDSNNHTIVKKAGPHDESQAGEILPIIDIHV